MPWVPRISPKEDEEVEAPASKASEFETSILGFGLRFRVL